MPKVYKKSSEIFAIFIYAVIEFLYIRPVKKTQNMFLQLATTFAWDNFYKRDTFFNGFVNNTV